LSIFTNKLWLAPLAGYTDQAFRRVCKAHHADVLVSEMVSSDGLIRDSKRTFQYLDYQEQERPFGVQIFGNDPLTMAKAAEFVLTFQPDFIDINMGCPVKKVIRRGAGSALMKEPQIASHIITEVAKAIAGRVPLSVKFRSGWDNNELNYMDFGKMVEDSGADAACLHARTTKQMFSGLSNWDHIRNLKEHIGIPLIGNGDVKSPADAMRMYNETGCDSVMIGRGALGKPWIFENIKDFQQTGSFAAISHHDILQTVLQHIDFALEFKRESVVIKEIRAHTCFYTKGLPGGAELRQNINHCTSIKDLKSMLTSHLLIDSHDR
jgi:tRNA-dihydrouridine synthase B